MNHTTDALVLRDLDRNASWIRALAARLISDEGGAEDLAQETWLAALQRGPSADRSLRPWLTRVARNLAAKPYQKPIKLEEIQLIVARAQNLNQLEAENRRLAEARGGEALAGFITTHPDLLHTCEELRRLAGTDITVLLTGESGTGKEVMARAIHELSPRRKGLSHVVGRG